MKTQRGQGSLVIMVVMMVSVGMVMIGVTRPFQTELAYAKVGMDVTQLTATVMGRVKEFLVTDVNGCTAENKAFETLRTFDSNSGTIELTGSSSFPCLIEDNEAGLLSDWQVRVEQLRLDRAALLRRVRVTVLMRTQETNNTFVRSHRLSRDYDVRIPSFAFFNISFFGIPKATPLVTVFGSGKLTVHGRSIYAEGLPLTLDEIYTVNDHLNPGDGLAFLKTFHIQPYQLIVDGVQPVVDMKELRDVFHEGIEPRSLSYETLTQFKPTDPAVQFDGTQWNQNFDYGPHASRHLQLPEPPGSGITRASCEHADYPYTPGRANFTVLPDPTPGSRPNIDGVTDLNFTCDAGEDFPRPFVHLKVDQDLTINFGDTVDDRRFCGLIAAKVLTINLGSAYDDYYLIGNLMVERLVVNTGGRKLHIFNPRDKIPLHYEILGDNKGGRDNDFARLSISIGKNFFLPFIENSPFMPAGSSSLLRDCNGDGSLWAYEDTYPPKHSHADWSDIAAHCRNSVRIAEKVT